MRISIVKSIRINFIALLAFCSVFYQANAMETIKKASTVHLRRFASLLHEQQFFIESADAQGSDPLYSAQQLNRDVFREVRYASYMAEVDSEKYADHIKSLGASFNIAHLELAHLCAGLKTFGLFDEIVNGLKNFKEERLLEPFQSFITLLQAYKQTCVTAPEFIEMHTVLFKQVQQICALYRSILPEIKHYYDNILEELTQRQRKGTLSLRSHYFADEMLPLTFQMSTVYAKMFEKQSKKKIDALFAPDNKPRVSQQKKKKASANSASPIQQPLPAKEQPKQAADDKPLSLGLGKQFANEHYVFPPYKSNQT